MELLLLILGGVFSSAIIFMVVERLRSGKYPDETEDMFDHTGYKDPIITQDMRDKFEAKKPDK